MSIFYFFTFIISLTFSLLSLSLLLGRHTPYSEKNSKFECGFHSFRDQNKKEFHISFFIFALLFLLFDLEILLVYPYVVSSYNNGYFGLISLIIFLLLLTAGFVFEYGKGALSLESRQNTYDRTNVSSPVPKVKSSNSLNLYSKRRFYSTQSTPANDPVIPVRVYSNFDTDKVNILLDNRGKSGVYRIKNLVNGKTYIGSSINISPRISKYYSLSSLLKDNSMVINRALLKYGYSNFSFEIIEYCEKAITLERENYYLKTLKPDYNVSVDGSGSNVGS